MACMRILDQSASELRATRTSEKWASYDPDVLPLWVAEMDARPCPDVVEAVTAMVSRGDTGYARHTSALGEALAGFAGREWGWTPDLTGHRVVPDVMIGIGEVIRHLTPADSPVVVSSPVYNSFYGLLALLGREVVHAPLSPDHRIDPDALDHAFAQAGPGAAHILCNPQNPTGTLHTADELATVAALAERHQTLVISDEIHAPLVRAGETFVPYLSVPGSERGLALHSASKAFNLAALRAAVLLSGTQVRTQVAGMRSHVAHSAQQVALEAQRAAWSSDGRWLAQLRSELDERSALLSRLAAEHLPGVRAHAGPSTYLAWWDCSGLGLEDPAAHFLEQARVAVVTGRSYSPAHQQWVRVNYAASPEVITEAVTRIADSL